MACVVHVSLFLFANFKNKHHTYLCTRQKKKRNTAFSRNTSSSRLHYTLLLFLQSTNIDRDKREICNSNQPTECSSHIYSFLTRVSIRVDDLINHRTLMDTLLRPDREKSKWLLNCHHVNVMEVLL